MERDTERSKEIKDDLIQAVERLAGRVQLAILFGSWAGGKQHPGSDVDLGVWVGSRPDTRKVSVADKRHVLGRLAEFFQGDHLDVVFLNEASPLLWWKAAQGIALHEAEPGLFARFCSLALRRHEDSRRFYGADQEYLDNFIRDGKWGRRACIFDKKIVRRKLVRLSRYIKELKQAKTSSFEEYQGNDLTRRATERLLQLVVEVAVDVNTHVAVNMGKAPPRDSFSSFLALGEAGLIDKSLAQRLAPFAEQRNVLVHEYEGINDMLIYESVPEAIDLFGRYVEQMNRNLKKTNG